MAAAAVLFVGQPMVADAGGQLTGRDIQNNSIQSKDIQDDNLKSRDIQDGSLRAKDFAEGELPAGAQGEAGPQGEVGPQGAIGPQGVPGATGSTGARGATGEQGDTGAPGPAGPVDGPAVLMGRTNVDPYNSYTCFAAPLSGIEYPASCSPDGLSSVSMPIPTAKDLRNVWASTSAPVSVATNFAIYDAETDTELLSCTIATGERMCSAAGPIALARGTNLAIKVWGSPVSVSVSHALELWHPSTTTTASSN